MRRAAAHAWTCVLFTRFIIIAEGRSQDVHVTCQYTQDCLLPCSFTAAGSEEISWFRQDVLIYKSTQNTDTDDEPLASRTSVLDQELSRGNASLILRRCALNDKGHYKCQVTKGAKKEEYFIALKVEAPIRSVNLEVTRLSGYKEFKCSTSNVYPAPHVHWSTDPPTPAEKLKYTTRKTSDKQGLYFMESKLKRLGQSRHLTYICTINSSSAAQMWTASLTETVHNNVTLTSTVLYSFFTWTQINSAEGQDITIPCRSPWNLQNFTLTWSFTKANNSTVISTYDSETQLVSNRWNGTAWLEPQRVQDGDGSLRLLSVQSSTHTGTFTCNISALQRNHVGQTRVNITPPHSENENQRTESSRPWWIPVVVVVALILLIAAVIVGIVKIQNKRSQTDSTETARYSKEVKVSVNRSEEITEGSHLNPAERNECT